MNPGAIELYADHGIDLAAEPLEIAVCAQHNNGGLAGNLWWESTNIKHLFPVGEVNGSHGVTGPAARRLNAGQVGAFRAAEFIAQRYRAVANLGSKRFARRPPGPPPTFSHGSTAVEPPRSPGKTSGRNCRSG